MLVATTTPDLVFPSTACIVQSKLGMTNGSPAFDLQAVCSGFVYALSVADQFIKTGAAKHVLVIGAETLSRITDWNDRGNCILLGDGAGAVVLGASTEPGIIATHMHADGRHKESAAHHQRPFDRHEGACADADGRQRRIQDGGQHA